MNSIASSSTVINQNDVLPSQDKSPVCKNDGLMEGSGSPARAVEETTDSPKTRCNNPSHDKPPSKSLDGRTPQSVWPVFQGANPNVKSVEGEEDMLVDSKFNSIPVSEIDMVKLALIGMNSLKGNQTAEDYFIGLIDEAIKTPNMTIEMLSERLSHLEGFPEINWEQLLPVESNYHNPSRSATKTRGSNSPYLLSTAQSEINELEHAVRILKKGSASERLLRLVRDKANTIIRQLVDIDRVHSDKNFKDKVIEVAHIIKDAKNNGVLNINDKFNKGVSITSLADYFSAKESWLVNEVQKVKECVAKSLKAINIPTVKCQISWEKNNNGATEIALKVEIEKSIIFYNAFVYFLGELDTEEKFIMDHTVDMESAQASQEWAKKNNGYVPFLGIYTDTDNPENSEIEVKLNHRTLGRIDVSSNDDENLRFSTFINMNGGNPKANYENIFKKFDELKARLISRSRHNPETVTRGAVALTRDSSTESRKTEVPENLIHYSEAFKAIFNKETE